MKLIIAGSRGFSDYELVCRNIDEFLEEHKLSYKDIEIISGGADGADKLGERYAREHEIKITRFIPDWNMYGKGAGPIRNAAIAEYAKSDGFLFLFWDGKSRGSQSMLYEASTRNIPYKLINYMRGSVFDGCEEEICLR